MRDYGRIYCAFWTSTDIQSLTDQGKLLAAYLLTCSHATIAGVFHLPDGYVAEDLSWSPETVSKAFRELNEKGFANRCATSKWVWLRKFLEWNAPENPNQWKAVRKMAGRVPGKCTWLSEFERFLNPSDTPTGNRSETLKETVSKSGTGAGGGTGGGTGTVTGAGEEAPPPAQPPEGSPSRERVLKNSSLSKSPARERRNDTFERINADVLRLITEVGFEADDPKRIAHVLHISEAQAKTAIGQLRDRGLMPAEARA